MENLAGSPTPYAGFPKSQKDTYKNKSRTHKQPKVPTLPQHMKRVGLKAGKYGPGTARYMGLGTLALPLKTRAPS